MHHFSFACKKNKIKFGHQLLSLRLKAKELWFNNLSITNTCRDASKKISNENCTAVRLS